MVQFYLSSFEEQLEAMAEQHHSSMDSGSSAEDQTSCVVHPNACETSMWEEWTQAASTGDDSVSTSNFLPDLSSSVSSRLSFQSDMLSSWMSGFHPLSQPSLSPDHHLSPSSDPPPFLHSEGLALDSEPSLPDIYPPRSIATSCVTNSKQPSSELYPSSLPFPAVLPSDSTTIDVKSHDDVSTGLPLMCGSKSGSVSRRLRHVLGPLSPSSPLAFQNGLLNPLGDPWDGACHSPMAWTSTGQTYGAAARSTTSFIPDHSASAIDHLESVATTSRLYGHQGVPACKPRHTDIFIGPNGTFETTPGGWTPQFYDGCETAGSSVTPMKLMASLREAGGHGEAATSGVSCSEHVSFLRGGQDRTTTSMPSILADCKRAESPAWPGKHRLELVEIVDGTSEDGKLLSPPQLKRPKLSVDNANALWNDHILKGAELRSYTPSAGSSLAAQAMDIIAIGPALNTNGKPRARRGSATDPQSVYARHRREKINERLKSLQNLVPNGAKVDIVTMLDEAIHYVKFLQNQLELLNSDELWVYATPNNYNGMDISEVLSGTMVHSESSA